MDPRNAFVRSRVLLLIEKMTALRRNELAGEIGCSYESLDSIEPRSARLIIACPQNPLLE